MEQATEQEYLEWFYHTMRQGKTEYFAYRMAQRFQAERGKTCPYKFFVLKKADEL